MFEKESNGMTEDERVDFVIALKRKMCLKNGKVTDSDVYFQGVKDGYNKANEWHYVKDGDLPKGESAVLIYWKSGDWKCASVVEPCKVTEDKHIIAWKEIVLPKENE